jgi:hypothetical protein
MPDENAEDGAKWAIFAETYLFEDSNPLQN